MNATGNLIPKRISAIVLAIISFFISCDSPTDILNANDTQVVNSESVNISYSNEPADISSSVIASLSRMQYAGARTTSEPISVNDDRLGCNTTTITLTRTGTKISPSGFIVIDFGSGCTDSRGVTRKGQIYIKYGGNRWFPEAFIQDSLVNYYRNGVHIEGVQTLTVQVSADTTHLQFKNELKNGKVTFADGSVITRTHNITREWRRASPAINSEWVTLAGGYAMGKDKNGSDYLMTIADDLVERISCVLSKVYIPVSGTEIITVDNKEYTIDFGNGDCDNKITVTFKGQSKTINVSEDGN